MSGSKRAGESLRAALLRGQTDFRVITTRCPIPTPELPTSLPTSVPHLHRTSSPTPPLTCLPSTSAVTSPFPPAPLAVRPTLRMYSEGSLGKSKRTTCSTNDESMPREALRGEKSVNVKI